MNNSRVETRWLTEEESRSYAVIVCGQPESPDPDPLAPYVTRPTISRKRLRDDLSSIGDPLETSVDESESAEQKAKWDELVNEMVNELELFYALKYPTCSTPQGNCGQPESPDPDPLDSESSSSGYIYTSTPLGNYGNYMLAPYVTRPTISRKRIRGRRLNFDDFTDLTSIGNPLAKRVAVDEFINYYTNELEQPYSLRYPTCSHTEDQDWLTEEEYRRMNAVIVCGPPDSPAPETLDSDLPDYEAMMADNPPTLSSGECIAVSTKKEVKNNDSLGACATPRNSPEPEHLEASDTYSITSNGYEASSEYSEDESESNSSGSIYTPDRNTIMERYVATPTSTRKRLRNRRLDHNNMNLIGERLDIAVEESESDEPEPKRAAVTKWIDDMEQLFDLRSGVDNEE